MWLNAIVDTLRETRNDLRDEATDDYSKGVADGYGRALGELWNMMSNEEAPSLELIDKKIRNRYKEASRSNGKSTTV